MFKLINWQTKFRYNILAFSLLFLLKMFFLSSLIIRYRLLMIFKKQSLSLDQFCYFFFLINPNIRAMLSVILPLVYTFHPCKIWRMLHFSSVKNLDNMPCLKQMKTVSVLRLLCPPDPWYLQGTALLNGFQSSKLSGSFKIHWVRQCLANVVLFRRNDL